MQNEQTNEPTKHYLPMLKPQEMIKLIAIIDFHN